MLKKKWKCRPKYIRKFSQKLILNDWRDTGAELSGNREKQVVHKERDHDAKQSKAYELKLYLMSQSQVVVLFQSQGFIKKNLRACRNFGRLNA